MAEDSRLRLTLVISSLRLGGAEGVLARIASGLAGRGHQVRLLTLEDASAPVAQPLHPAVRHQALGLSAPAKGPLSALCANLWRVVALRRAILAQPADAVLSFMTETSITTLFAVGGRLPVIAAERVHPGSHRLGPAWSALRRLAYGRAWAIAVQTPDVPLFFPPGLRGRCVVLPNPVAEPPGGQLEPLLARQLNAPGPLLLAMGRLAPQKGFDLLLEAFALLAPEHPAWRLVIVGEGAERPRLEAQVRRLGLADRAFLPGPTTCPALALRRADLFVLSSRYEGFPNALAEALACGTPALAFGCPGGPAEIVRHGVDGLLVPPGDVEALAQACARLMGDEPLRSRMAARAPEVLSRFGLEKVLDLWEALFRQAQSGGHGPRREKG